MPKPSSLVVEFVTLHPAIQNFVFCELSIPLPYVNRRSRVVFWCSHLLPEVECLAKSFGALGGGRVTHGCFYRKKAQVSFV